MGSWVVEALILVEVCLGINERGTVWLREMAEV